MDSLWQEVLHFKRFTWSCTIFWEKGRLSYDLTTLTVFRENWQNYCFDLNITSNRFWLQKPVLILGKWDLFGEKRDVLGNVWTSVRQPFFLTWMFGRGNKVFFINFNCVFLCLEHIKAGIVATFWGLQLTRLIQSLFDYQLSLRMQKSKQHIWQNGMLYPSRIQNFAA